LDDLGTELYMRVLVARESRRVREERAMRNLTRRSVAPFAVELAFFFF